MERKKKVRIATREEQWKEENGKGIRSYNRFVEENGVFIDSIEIMSDEDVQNFDDHPLIDK